MINVFIVIKLWILFEIFFNFFSFKLRLFLNKIRVINREIIIFRLFFNRFGCIKFKLFLFIKILNSSKKIIVGILR